MEVRGQEKSPVPPEGEAERVPKLFWTFLSKTQVSCPCSDSNPGLSSPYSSHYTNSAYLVPKSTVYKLINHSHSLLTFIPLIYIIAVTNKHTAKLHHVGSLYILTYDARKLKHKISYHS